MVAMLKRTLHNIKCTRHHRNVYSFHAVDVVKDQDIFLCALSGIQALMHALFHRLPPWLACKKRTVIT